MKLHTNQTKKTYILPQLEIIALDNDISLTMSSLTPPFGPTESALEPMVFSDELISPIL